VVKKFEFDEVLAIAKKLGKISFTGDENLRDVYTLGLKLLITSIPDSYGSNICTELVSIVHDGLASLALDAAQISVCLDILKDVLRRFGAEIQEQHRKLLAVLTPLLQNPTETLRRKAIGVTGNLLFFFSMSVYNFLAGVLVKFINDDHFHALMKDVIAHMKTDTQNTSLYAYIQIVGMVSRSAGPRIASYLDQIVPLLSTFCTSEGKSSEEENERIELIENCLQAFESLILRCPSEITTFIESLITIAIHYLAYDPHYSYDAGSNGDKMDVGDDDEGDWGDEADDGFEPFEDESDMSWKVRLSAARVLDAFIKAKDDILRLSYDKLCSSLIQRFKERINSVKLEVFRTFVVLLKAAVVRSDSRAEVVIQSPRHVRNRSSFDLLENHVRNIVHESIEVLESGSPEAKLGVLAVLNELIIVRQGGLHEYAEDIGHKILAVVVSGSVTFKTEGLSILSLIFKMHPPIIVTPLISDVLPVLSSSVDDPYPKMKIQALLLCSFVAKSLRTFGQPVGPEYVKIANVLFDLIHSQLVLHMVEVEVKEAALLSAATLLAQCADCIQDKIHVFLSLIFERLTNEVTRRPALAALTAIAESPLQIDLNSIFPEAVIELTSYFKKHSPALKYATASALESMVRNVSTVRNVGSMEVIVKESVLCIT
jgi:cullin-associated NEDD8-dissociated protein 1